MGSVICRGIMHEIMPGQFRIRCRAWTISLVSKQDLLKLFEVWNTVQCIDNTTLMGSMRHTYLTCAIPTVITTPHLVIH